MAGTETWIKTPMANDTTALQNFRLLDDLAERSPSGAEPLFAALGLNVCSADFADIAPTDTERYGLQ